MPIKVQSNLPAIKVLESENIFVMPNEVALKQDIRPLKILILNLMPTKITTETQLLRLLGNTPLQIDIELLQMASHTSKNTSPHHLTTFYKTFDEVKDDTFDGMIITGAPVEQLDFEQVDYWDELCEIMEWSKTHVYSTLHICWGAQAGLYYHYGVPKHTLPEKLFGVFRHRVTEQGSFLFRGFDDSFSIPHSRHTTIYREEIEKVPALNILAESDKAGVYAVATKDARQVYLMGHTEYDPDTLAKEYFRDKDAGLPIHIPENYFPNDDDSMPPICCWRSCANLLFGNWLNYVVYQETPFDVTSIPPMEN